MWPRYKIRRVGGLKGLGEPEDNRSPRVGGVGENAERSERRGKSVSYEGAIEAKTLRQLEEAAADLRAAFADLTSEGRMDVSWLAGNTEYAGVPAKFYEARALTCEVVEELQGRRWVWPFVIGLRMGDPRYFDEETEVYEVAISETNTSYDFT